MKELKGRRLDIALGHTDHAPHEVLQHRAHWAAKGFKLPEYTAPVSIPHLLKVPGVGTIVSRKLSWFALIGAYKASCAKCTTKLEQLNRRKLSEWTEEVILQDAKEIAERRKGIASLFPAKISEGVIAHNIREALKEHKAELKKVPPRPSRPPRQVSTRIVGHTTTTSEQNQLYQSAISNPPSPKPFSTPPLINLVWHIWPVGESWKWHVHTLNELLPSITGQIIIGIATDRTTHSAAEVKALFNDSRIVFIENTNNHTTGELVTAQPAFAMLDDLDSVTVYGHAKGVREHTRNSEAVRVWTECMYETVTFNLKETIQRLEEGYDVVGSFRTFGFEPLRAKHKWHYSGTFFNFRTQAYLKNGVPPFQAKYGAVEAWIGDHTPLNKAYCVLRDNTPLKFQYDETLSPIIIAEQLIWESKRFGGVPMEQHLREYLWLKSRLTNVRKMLIIGSRHGGMEYHLRKDLQIETVSVDTDPLVRDTPGLIIGSSHSEDIRDQIRKHTFDAIFVDGDHTYEGVKKDWEFVKTLGAPLVYFHDFTNASYHRATGCNVHALFQEIVSQGYTTTTKAVGCGWGGIAEVKL